MEEKELSTDEGKREEGRHTDMPDEEKKKSPDRMELERRSFT